jgi:hypothetical protein
MGNVIETVLLGVLGSLLAAEIVFRHRIWCTRIINSAVNRISDPNEREVRREEWLAALHDQVGLYASFKHAIGCFVGAPAVAAASRIPVRLRAKSSSTRFKITIDTKSFWSLIKKFRHDSSEDLFSRIFRIFSLLWCACVAVYALRDGVLRLLGWMH